MARHTSGGVCGACKGSDAPLPPSSSSFLSVQNTGEEYEPGSSSTVTSQVCIYAVTA